VRATARSSGASVSAYRGDAKTLLAFDLSEAQATNLAGFTVECQPPSGPAYYLFNTLRFADPGRHAQVASESANSSVNAPFHKFRWLHVPGSVHQGISPVYGGYSYAVSPRYLNSAGSMQPLDPSLTARVSLDVGPLTDGPVSLGFTRGYVQSQAFVNHFGLDALIRPADDTLRFDTTQTAGTNAVGQSYSFAQEYAWLGATARGQVFAMLAELRSDPSLTLDVFAYDLDEPDVISVLLELAAQGRVRIILDDSSLHHNSAGTQPEDEFAAQAAGGAAIKRGKFGRYAHDKILIVSKPAGAQKVLTGSTNFSINGLYVNANHVLRFDQPAVAAEYARLFEAVWAQDVKRAAYLKSDLAPIVR
jgi:PLD-like domain